MRLLVRPGDPVCGHFHGPSGGHPMGEKVPHFSSCLPLSPSKSIPGEQAVNEKRELSEDHRPASAHNAALPRESPMAQEYQPGSLSIGGAQVPTSERIFPIS